MRDIPDIYKGLYAKRKKSRKSAVRSFCLECVGYDPREVTKCTDKACPLWKWRLTG